MQGLESEKRSSSSAENGAQTERSVVLQAFGNAAFISLTVWN